VEHSVFHIVVVVERIEDSTVDFLRSIVECVRVLVVVDACICQVADLFLLRIFEVNRESAFFYRHGFDGHERRFNHVPIFFEVAFGKHCKLYVVIRNTVEVFFKIELSIELALRAVKKCS